ncbi:MAG: helix-turn-helix transcriptional regulator [Planctomycetes bacterium]|nr:helix-turn-helix transcriptional regulator [Planctomycetota bacterium]
MATELISAKETLLREVLERVGDKWSLLVIEELDEDEPVRFSDLRRQVGGISQKMLTKTLRQLERDGLITRKVHAEVPPRVEYRLTSLGSGLGEALCSMWFWVEEHMNDVQRARRKYDKANS